MATHSSTHAWKISQSEGPGRLQSIGSQRVRCDLVTKQQYNINLCFCVFLIFIFNSFLIYVL